MRGRRGMSESEFKAQMLKIDLRKVPRGHLELCDPDADELCHEQKKEIGEGTFWYGRYILPDFPDEFLNRAIVTKPEVCSK